MRFQLYKRCESSVAIQAVCLIFDIVYNKLQEVFNPLLYNRIFFFFAVLGFELRAYILSHSTSPFL
jgi:hypothetical protein